MADGGERRGGNLVSLALSQGFRLGSGLAINVMLMRALGVEGYGVYGYVMTLVGLAAFGASMGMNRLINRELARDPDAAGRMVATGLAATAGLSVLTAGAIALWIQQVDGRPEVLAAGLLAALAMGLQSMATVPEAAFHARSHMAPSVRGQVLGRVVLVAACAGLLLAGAGVLAIFVAQVLDAVATLLLILWNYRRHIGFGGMRTDRRAVVALVREAFPFGMNALFGSIYLSVDVLLLQVMRGDTEVGLYRGAVMLIALFPVLANTLTTGIYPRMARHLGDRAAAGGELAFASRILLLVSLPAAVGGFLVAEDLMVFLGGSDFARSALPFMIMAPLLPLRFLNNGFAMTLSTLNRQGDRTRGVMIAAVLNLGLNLVFIPKYGAAGAAGTTVATEVVLLAWNRWRIAPLVQGLGIGGSLLRVGVAAGLMGAALVATPELHVLVDIGVGVGVFAVVSRLSGAWARRDLGRLRRV